MNLLLRLERDFQRLSIPARDEQQSILEKSLRENGCLEPIVTWNGVLIDGYKRYRFCMDEGIDISVEENEFPSKEEAISWVCRQRIRDYSPLTAAYRYLVGKLYIEQKTIYRAIRKQPESERIIQLDPLYNRASHYVGKELQINRSTVEHHGTYALAMDQIAEKCPALFEALLREQVILSIPKTEEIAKYDEKQLREMCRTEWRLDGGQDAKEKIRNRPKKVMTEAVKEEIPLALGIKEMPVYDPDVELLGLTLTIPTWIMAIRRLESKAGKATDKAKAQLSKSLEELKNQANELLEVIAHG